MGTTAHFDPGAQPHDHSCAAGSAGCCLLKEFTGLGMVGWSDGHLWVVEIAICVPASFEFVETCVSSISSTIGTELCHYFLQWPQCPRSTHGRV